MIAKSNPMRLFLLLALVLAVRKSHAASRWDKPAADLAVRIAEILGPGQAQIAVANRSTVPASEVPGIRRQLEDELRAHGVQPSGAESANQIRITLSETARERLWVAEIAEGSQTRYAMVSFARQAGASEAPRAAILLTRKVVWNSSEPADSPGQSPVLAALETPSGLVLLERDSIAIETTGASGWHEAKRVNLGRSTVESRDPRGMLVPGTNGFTAYAAGTQCQGKYDASDAAASEWTIQCHESDDPWPLNSEPGNEGNLSTGAANGRCFFNASRNFYTGTLSPSPGANLPPFFSLAVLPGPRIVVGGIDGKVQMLDGPSLKPLAGTRDWGSDFAAIHTGCGSGTQILASSSGEAESDSLRAYEIDAEEAVPVSGPLEMDGTVTALWTAPGGASALAVIRKSPTEFEVARVAALCP